MEENPFYPDGMGGQIGDRGTLGDARVLFVYDDRIEIDKPVDVGVHLAKADIERRKEVARQHTAQHILSASIEKLFDVETVGFHMGEEVTTIDLEHDVDIEKAIELSNDIVMADLKVEEMILSPQEISDYALRKPVSEKALKSGNIRLIKIEDFDLNACGGFHVSKTGEIGSIRAIHTERVKGGFQRVWFVAGKRALKDCLQREQVLTETSKLFDASWTDLKSRVEKVLRDLKNKNTAMKKMAESLAMYMSKGIKDFDILEVEEIIASFISRSKQDVPYALKISDSNVIVCIPHKKKNEVMEWAKMNEFKGGGKGPIYRFAFKDFKKFREAFLKLREKE